MYIPLLSANVFHICKKIKKCKDGMSQKKNQGRKRLKKVKKDEKMNPKKEKDHESVQVQMPLLFIFPK